MRYLDREDKHNFRSLIQAAADGGEGELPVEDAAYAPARIGPGAESFRRIARMATDPAWNLPRLDRQRIAATYLYISRQPEDGVPGTEWSILQAAAVELIAHDCHAELEMYGEFLELRNNPVNLPFAVGNRGDWLRYKRESLQPAPGRRFLGMRRSRVRH